VCGALALFDEEPSLAGIIVERGLRSVQRALAEYAPDGAWGEGPGYWDYATRYTVFLLSSLEASLGTDFGLAEKAKGFRDTGLFPIHLTGPGGETFNFADVGQHHRIRSSSLLWLARRFGRRSYAQFQQERARPDALDILWDVDTEAMGREDLSRAVHLRGADVVTMRSGWNDPEALFVGVKGGSNAVNHSHLDLGSFILEWLGVRWAVDLGSDDYNLPGYFRPEGRWNFYRLRAEGHNTLVINPSRGPDQDPKASAQIVKYEPDASHCRAVIDLSAAYAPSGAREVRRTVDVTFGAAARDGSVTVTDTVVLKEPGEVSWMLHTGAEVGISGDGKTAILTQNTRRIRLQILHPAEGRFATGPAAPLPSSPRVDGQDANAGVQRLSVRLDRVVSTTISIEITAIF